MVPCTFKDFPEFQSVIILMFLLGVEPVTWFDFDANIYDIVTILERKEGYKKEELGCFWIVAVSVPFANIFRSTLSYYR